MDAGEDGESASPAGAGGVGILLDLLLGVTMNLLGCRYSRWVASEVAPAIARPGICESRSHRLPRSSGLRKAVIVVVAVASVVACQVSVIGIQDEGTGKAVSAVSMLPCMA